MSIQAYSYRRISSRVQSKRATEEKERDSLDTQFENATSWVARQPSEKNIILNNELVLEEIKSASSGANVDEGKLGYFLSLVESGKVDGNCYLLIDTWSRFSRQRVMEAVSLFDRIAGCGVTIVTLDDVTSTAEESSMAFWNSPNWL